MNEFIRSHNYLSKAVSGYMLQSINFEQWVSHSLSTYFQSSSSFPATDVLQRIKEKIILIFSNIGEFFSQILEKRVVEQANIKTIAILGCICLITLFGISILLFRDSPTTTQPRPSIVC